MPRKPGLPPPIIAIEDIATGQRVDMVDDFTGQALPQPDAKPPRIQDGMAEQARLAKIKQDQAQALLDKLRFGAKETKQDTVRRPKAITIRRI